jgi:carbonic anhydrase
MSNQIRQSELDRLKSGNERFRNDKLERKLQDGMRREALVGGQQPFAVVLTCADSRVVPELAFDAGLGELFVLRVAGNVANPSTIASIEYAVAHLGTRLIVVMGHESCGAVGAALEGGDSGKNLSHLLGFIEPAIAAADDRTLNAVVKRNAQNTANLLVSESEIIGKAVEEEGVRVITAYYNLGSGVVDFDQSV